METRKRMAAKSMARTTSTTAKSAVRNVRLVRCVPTVPVRQIVQRDRKLVAANVSTWLPTISRTARRVPQTGWIATTTRRQMDVKSTAKMISTTAKLAVRNARPARYVLAGLARRLAQKGRVFVAANVSTCPPTTLRIVRRVRTIGLIATMTRRRMDVRSMLKPIIHVVAQRELALTLLHPAQITGALPVRAAKFAAAGLVG